LSQVHLFENDSVIRGVKWGDDAGVFRLSSELALVQTVDVFTPVVDEPIEFGRISAANSFSDCYAMGATPICCLSIMVVPSVGFPPGVAEEILEGADEVCREAGAPIIGGHTLKLPEPAFGLAVTGIVNPQEVVTLSSARVGDKLVLTKPIGTGIITTCAKKGICPSEELSEAVRVMRRLNKGASDAMRNLKRASATDVTGFGLLGHLYHILSASRVSAEISFSKVPVLPGALERAEENSPGGTHSNLAYAEGFTDFTVLSRREKLVLCDAQTSGGLLISCGPEEVERLLSDLRAKDTPCASIIGEITEGVPPRVIVHP